MAFRVNGDRVLAKLTYLTGIAQNELKVAISMPHFAVSPIFTWLPHTTFDLILEEESDKRQVSPVFLPQKLTISVGP
jgi:hypothetical protein